MLNEPLGSLVCSSEFYTEVELLNRMADSLADAARAEQEANPILAVIIAEKLNPLLKAQKIIVFDETSPKIVRDFASGSRSYLFRNRRK